MSICKNNAEVSGGRGAASHVRPPGALPSGVFEDRCQTCGDCMDVCPAAAIGIDAHGFPYVADVLACGKCGLCADVCTRGAIAFTARTRAGFRLVQKMEAQSNLW